MPLGVDGRIELVDLSDPTGPREKSPYVANIIQVEGHSAPTPTSPAGGREGARVGAVPLPNIRVSKFPLSFRACNS